MEEKYIKACEQIRDGSKTVSEGANSVNISRSGMQRKLNLYDSLCASRQAETSGQSENGQVWSGDGDVHDRSQDLDSDGDEGSDDMVDNDTAREASSEINGEDYGDDEESNNNEDQDFGEHRDDSTELTDDDSENYE